LKVARELRRKHLDEVVPRDISNPSLQAGHRLVQGDTWERLHEGLSPNRKHHQVDGAPISDQVVFESPFFDDTREVQTCADPLQRELRRLGVQLAKRRRLEDVLNEQHGCLADGEWIPLGFGRLHDDAE
jgi:hypothetical protein